MIRPKCLADAIKGIARRHPGMELNTDTLWELLCLEEPQQAEMVKQHMDLNTQPVQSVQPEYRSHRQFMAKALGEVKLDDQFDVWTDYDGRKIRYSV